MKTNYLWGAVLALLLIGGFMFFRAHKVSAPGPMASSSSEGTTTVDLGNGQSVTLPPGAKLEIIPTATTTTNNIKQPSLTTAISIAPSVSADLAAALRSKEQEVIAELTATPGRVDVWMKLGSYRKIAQDYAGASAVWEYVAKVAPKEIAYIAYGNLGELNLDYLKEYSKAETYYLQALKLNPTVIDYYRELYLMYTTVYKTNTTAALDILNQGLAANPGNTDLLQLKADYQKTHTQ